MNLLVTDPAAVTAERLGEWLAPLVRVFVLTGAGCSTASGIPDYRDAHGEWKRSPPVNFRDYVDDPLVHARYWARSFIGWPVMSTARPNAAHHALADWQHSGQLSQLLTQNVDSLHQRAGSRGVIDLHGRIDEVICLGCKSLSSRLDVQQRLAAENPSWAGLTAETAPDGDADLEGRDFSRFRAPCCGECGGMLKPDVVFFGENVPRLRYEAARVALEASDALLVVGSSLMVYSGFRFARLAHESGKPVALLGLGKTRADAIADMKLEGDCAAVLPLALPGIRAPDVATG